MSFVPTDLAREIYRAVIAPLKAIEPEHYFYAPDSMHLTIKNIRSVHNPPQFTGADIKKVDRLFARVVPQHRPFGVQLEELVPFTTSLSLIAYSDERLHQLVQTLDSGLSDIGLPDDKRYVSKEVIFGNVTLCRYMQPPSERFLHAVARRTHAFTAELKIKTVHLITCNAVGSYWLNSSHTG